MITHSTDYIEYCRQTAKDVKALHDLALRGAGKEAITREIQHKIVDALELTPRDELVDIGCGDGTLLAMAKRAGVKSTIGLLATEEEVAVLKPSGFDVRQGLTDNLPLPDESASAIVCNSVLLVVPSERIPASLAEIYRIAKPGARIYLGEIPFVAGRQPELLPKSSYSTLAELFRKHGLRTCLGMLRRMIYWKLTGRPMIIYDGAGISFHASLEEFISMAQAAGLRLIRYWQHDYPNTRNNYLFVRD